jgi:outer membrane protein assembly factor BamB
MYFKHWHSIYGLAISFSLLVLLAGCGAPTDVSPIAGSSIGGTAIAGDSVAGDSVAGNPEAQPALSQSEDPLAIPKETPQVAPPAEPEPRNPQLQTPVAPEGNPEATKETAPEETAKQGSVGKPGVDWPTFLGPTGDNKSSEVGFNFDWKKNPPPILWTRKLGTSYGIGSISQGKMYQFDRHENTARLVCLDPKTGAEHWKFEYPTDYVDAYGYNNGPRCSPLVDNDRVYIFGAAGMLHCLKTADGSIVWKISTSEKYNVIQNFFGVGSSPVLEGNLLICMVGGSPEEDRGKGSSQLDTVTGNGAGIVAFDKMTGEVRYSITDELASYASLKLATINDRRWCFAFARGGLVGFEPKTGAVDFEYPWRSKVIESVNASAPVVVGDEVFISETYGPGSSLLKVAPKKFEVVWKDEERSRDLKMQTHWNTPVYHQEYLYGCSGRHTHNAELRCIHWKTGEVKWMIPELTRTSLMYVDNHFICLGEYGQLFAFKANPEKFEPVAELSLTVADPEGGEVPIKLLDYPCWAAPILSHGLLYVRGKDYLVCLDLTP